MIIFKEGRIAVDLGAKSFAKNQIGRIKTQAGVKFCPGRAFHAVIRPKRLRSIGHFDLTEGRSARVLAGERGMFSRMPILRQHDSPKFWHHRVDPRDDLIALCDRQRAAGTKIVLNINDNQGCMCLVHHVLLRLVLRRKRGLVGQAFGQATPDFRRVRAVHGACLSPASGNGQIFVRPLFRRAQIRYSAAMIIVAALYHFTRFSDPAALRGPLLDLALAQGIKGSLLLASEGINGTIAGTRSGIDVVLANLRGLPGCADLEWKESPAQTMPFGRMKVRLKREIVTMGQPDIDPKARVGHYVSAQDWNALISAPDVAVIDTRNDYEVSIGTFEGAVDPQTKSFGEFPGWWEANKERFHNKRIAMFCTGGIRCEKSTNFLLGQGVAEVFHLKGGILKYLEEVPQEDSLWQGQCFVFDERVSVGHGLVPGPHQFCRACRRPLLPQDRADPLYEEGVSCAQCRGETTDADRARYRERQKQMKLAEARGTQHLGG